MSYCEDFQGVQGAPLPEGWQITPFGSPVGAVSKYIHAGGHFGTLRLRQEAASPNQSGYYCTINYGFYMPGDRIAFRWRHDEDASHEYNFGLFKTLVANESVGQYAVGYVPAWNRFGVTTTNSAGTSIMAFDTVPDNDACYSAQLELGEGGTSLLATLYDKAGAVLENRVKTGNLIPLSPATPFAMGAKVKKVGARQSHCSAFLDWAKVVKRS